MSYAFERGESLSAAVRRIAGEQLDGALAALDDGLADDVEEAVHDVRKRGKHVRGLVRLAREPLGEDTYRWANRTVRDAARELSAARDATTLLATFEHVHPSSADDDARARRVRAALERHRADVALTIDRHDERVQRARAMLDEVRRGIDTWSIPDHGWSALEGGLGRTYRRGRKRARTARETSSAGDLHEWRKRAKYTMYHLRLIAGSSPSIVGALAEGFHLLSDLLGDLHDRDVLAAALGADRAPTIDAGAAAEETLHRIAVERRDLEQRAIALGSRLYAESPKVFGDRLGSYWAAWETFGDEPTTAPE